MTFSVLQIHDQRENVKPRPCIVGTTQVGSVLEKLDSRTAKATSPYSCLGNVVNKLWTRSRDCCFSVFLFDVKALGGDCCVEITVNQF